MEVVIKETDALNTILKAITSETTQEAIANESEDFKQGAMWGMSWAGVCLSVYAEKYIVDESKTED